MQVNSDAICVYGVDKNYSFIGCFSHQSIPYLELSGCSYLTKLFGTRSWSTRFLRPESGDLSRRPDFSLSTLHYIHHTASHCSVSNKLM